MEQEPTPLQSSVETRSLIESIKSHYEIEENTLAGVPFAHRLRCRACGKHIAYISRQPAKEHLEVKKAFAHVTECPKLAHARSRSAVTVESERDESDQQPPPVADQPETRSVENQPPVPIHVDVRPVAADRPLVLYANHTGPPVVTVTVNESVIPKDKPTAQWGIERLTQYLHVHLQIREQFGASAIVLGRRAAVETYRAGHALTLIREKMRSGRQWSSWQLTQGLNRSTVHKAMKLYRLAKDEKAIEGMPLGEALRLLSPPAPAKAKSEASAPIAGEESTPIAEKENGSKEEERAERTGPGETHIGLPQILHALNAFESVFKQLTPETTNSEQVEAIERRLAALLERVSQFRKASVGAESLPPAMSDPSRDDKLNTLRGADGIACPPSSEQDKGLHADFRRTIQGLSMALGRPKELL